MKYIDLKGRKMIFGFWKFFVCLFVCWCKARYIKVKVEHYLLFMFSPPKISWVVSGIKYICLYLLLIFYLIQPLRKQIICFDFGKQNSVLPIVF